MNFERISLNKSFFTNRKEELLFRVIFLSTIFFLKNLKLDLLSYLLFYIFHLFIYFFVLRWYLHRHLAPNAPEHSLYIYLGPYKQTWIIVKTQRNSTQLKATLEQLVLELDTVVTCSTPPQPTTTTTTTNFSATSRPSRELKFGTDIH